MIYRECRAMFPFLRRQRDSEANHHDLLGLCVEPSGFPNVPSPTRGRKASILVGF